MSGLISLASIFSMAIAMEDKRSINYLRGVIPSSSVSENIIMSEGKTSGIPPTFVDTTNSPQDAASTMAMQKASVKEVFRKI